MDDLSPGRFLLSREYAAWAEAARNEWRQKREMKE